MGHSNNPSPTANYNAALTKADTRSPEEEALGKAALKTLNWADKGDYTNPHDAGMFVNYADPAMLHRNDELAMNAGSQGISALGTPDPNYLATVKANTLAHEAERNAGQYEKDVKEGVGMASAVAGDEAHLELSRKLGILGTTADLYKSNMNKPRWWSYLLSGASGAASAFA